MTAADRWADALAAWAIPEEILVQAEESPWIHPPVLFDVPAQIPDTTSHEVAREAMPPNGSVLDIGCGGGIAACALIPPAAFAHGVDHQERMLEMFAKNTQARGAQASTTLGFWPEVAPQVLPADVVTCHHVVYNVSAINQFLLELSAHARRRVVIELPQQHPLSDHSAAWQHFWGLQRPSEPTYELLMQVLRELGIDAQVQTWQAPLGREIDPELAVEFMRIRLCLPKARTAEVADFMTTHPAPITRRLATVWWDSN